MLPFTQNHSFSPYGYYTVPNILNLSQIDTLKENITQINNQTNHSSNHRKSNIKWIPQEEEWYWLYQIFNKSLSYANEQMWGFNLNFIFESIQYTEYSSENLGEVGWHMDVGYNEASYRKLSIVYLLSHPSEYEGGELEFFVGGKYNQNIIKIKKEFNTAIIFPSYLLHRVTPITKGLRKSLVLWVGGTPFK